MQEEMGLPKQEDVMLLGIVSRLADHKGLDLVKYIGEEMFQENLQLVGLGSGEYMFESFFEEMQRKYPEKVSFIKGFIPPLARSCLLYTSRCV